MNGNGNSDFPERDVRLITLDDDDMVSPDEALARVGAVQARVGDNIATDTSTSKYGPKDGPATGAVNIGGAAGYAEGDVLTRFDGATAYNEVSKMGGVATGTGAESAATARRLAEAAAGQGTWEYRLDPAMRVNATGQTVQVPGQHNIVFVPEDKVVSRSTVTDRYGLVNPEAWDAAMDTVCDAVGNALGRLALELERPVVARRYFSFAVACDGASAIAYSGLGAAASLRGRFQSAGQYRDRARELAAEDPLIEIGAGNEFVARAAAGDETGPVLQFQKDRVQFHIKTCGS